MSTLVSSAEHALACDRLTITVGQRTLVDGLSLAIPRGSVTCILGCNGAGKTLTLHTLAGLRTPQSGAVLVAGRNRDQWPRRELALQLGLLTQTTEDPFPSTVLETVLIGRHPHIGFWQWENELDKAIAREALTALDVAEFEARDVATLSGGERRRVAIAALLAQDPHIMLLDEPINHLDPHHQLEVLHMLRSRTQANRTVVMSLHDAGLAARFADHVLMLFGTGQWRFGHAVEVLNEDSISQLYRMRMRQIEWEGGRTFVAVD